MNEKKIEIKEIFAVVNNREPCCMGQFYGEDDHDEVMFVETKEELYSIITKFILDKSVTAKYYDQQIFKIKAIYIDGIMYIRADDLTYLPSYNMFRDEIVEKFVSYEELDCQKLFNETKKSDFFKKTVEEIKEKNRVEKQIQKEKKIKKEKENKLKEEEKEKKLYLKLKKKFSEME